MFVSGSLIAAANWLPKEISEASTIAAEILNQPIRRLSRSTFHMPQLLIFRVVP
jgi:hypothetical protein